MRLRFLKPFLIGILLLSILIVAIRFNNWFTRWNGAIGIISLWVLCIMWVANLYYFKSEPFYLIVQKSLLWFRRTDSTWKFNAHYKDIAKDNGYFPWDKEKFAEYIASAMEELLKKPVVIKEQLLNRCSFRLDGLIHLSIRYDSNPTATVVVDKLLAPAHRYKEYIDVLTEIFSMLEKELRPREVAYSMHIKFPNHNPYFGFFIRHVPRNNLREFRCSFSPNSTMDTSIIDVQKDGIVIRTDSISKLRCLALDYLSLSKTLITGGNK